MTSIEERVSALERILRTTKIETEQLTGLSAASFENLHNHIDGLRADTDARFNIVEAKLDSFKVEVEAKLDSLQTDMSSVLKILADHFNKP